MAKHRHFQTDKLTEEGRQDRYLLAMALRFGIILAVLGGFFWSFADSSDLTFSHQALYSALLTQPVVIISIVVMAWRTQILGAGKLSFWVALKATALVGSLLLILPSRLSDLVKPVYLSEHSGLGLAKGFSLLLFERILDLLAVAALLLIALAIFSNQQMIQFGDTFTTLLAMLAVIGIGLALLFFMPQTIEQLLSRLPIPLIRKLSTHFFLALKDTADRTRLSQALIITGPLWLNSYMIFLVYFAVFGPSDIDAKAALFIFLAGTLGLVVTVTPGGIGTFEAAIALALQLYGFSFADGLLHGFMLRLVTLLPSVVITAILILNDDFRIAQLMKDLRAAMKRFSQQ